MEPGNRGVVRIIFSFIWIAMAGSVVGCDDTADQNSDQPSAQANSQRSTTKTPDTGLFRAILKAHQQVPALLSKSTVRQRLVKLETGLVAAMQAGRRRVRINLFPNLVVTVDLDRTPGEKGMPSFFGGTVVEPGGNEATSLVTFILQDNRLRGNIRMGGNLYRIQPHDDGLHLISEVAPVNLPEGKPQPAPVE